MTTATRNCPETATLFRDLLTGDLAPLLPDGTSPEEMAGLRITPDGFLREDSMIGPRAALVSRLAGFAGQYPWEWEPVEAFVSHLRSGAAANRGFVRAVVRTPGRIAQRLAGPT